MRLILQISIFLLKKRQKPAYLLHLKEEYLNRTRDTYGYNDVLLSSHYLILYFSYINYTNKYYYNCIIR